MALSLAQGGGGEGRPLLVVPSPLSPAGLFALEVGRVRVRLRQLWPVLGAVPEPCGQPHPGSPAQLLRPRAGGHCTGWVLSPRAGPRGLCPSVRLVLTHSPGHIRPRPCPLGLYS